MVQIVKLTWTTATETNVSHFEIYQSSEGNNWMLVDAVQARGNSSTSNTYELHSRKNSEITYYHLVSIDLDGKTQVFDPISISCGIETDEWKIYPVPANHKATIEITTETSSVETLLVTALNGKILLQKEVMLYNGLNYIHLDINTLQNGQYFVQILNKGELKSLKVVKCE